MGDPTHNRGSKTNGTHRVTGAQVRTCVVSE